MKFMERVALFEASVKANTESLFAITDEYRLAMSKVAEMHLDKLVESYLDQFSDVRCGYQRMLIHYICVCLVGGVRFLYKLIKED